MASAFSHAIASVAIGSFKGEGRKRLLFFSLLSFCAVIPDADVLAFKLGIPYESIWGHRGFTHSILFAVLLSGLVVQLFYHENKMRYFFYFCLATLSHSILDAMTTGGLGVGFFAPFSAERYFFPWRVIKVSPIGISKFFSKWGIEVLKSELLWVWLPSTIVILISYVVNKFFNRKN